MSQRRRIKLQTLAGFLVLGIGSVWATHRYLENWRAPTKSLWAQIKVGADETQVRSLLGQPKFEYTRESAPKDYYVPGYGHKVREISGKVLIYFGKSDLILYVYFDTDGRVEETVVATS